MLASSSSFFFWSSVAETAPLMCLECVPQRFYSSMRFSINPSLTEKFLDRIKRELIVFARVDGAVDSGPCVVVVATHDRTRYVDFMSRLALDGGLTAIRQ